MVLRGVGESLGKVGGFPYIDHAWLHQKGIMMHKLEYPIGVYNIDGSMNRGGNMMKLLSYCHTKDTRNTLCLKYVIWENLILSLAIHGYINILQRLTGRLEKWKRQDVQVNVIQQEGGKKELKREDEE